jgi:hypothetical protein
MNTDERGFFDSLTERVLGVEGKRVVFGFEESQAV